MKLVQTIRNKGITGSVRRNEHNLETGVQMDVFGKVKTIKQLLLVVYGPSWHRAWVVGVKFIILRCSSRVSGLRGKFVMTDGGESCGVVSHHVQLSVWACVIACVAVGSPPFIIIIIIIIVAGLGGCLYPHYKTQEVINYSILLQLWDRLTIVCSCFDQSSLAWAKKLDGSG